MTNPKLWLWITACVAMAYGCPQAAMVAILGVIVSD